MPKPCAKKNKIRNPRTKRCVKKDGAIGRKLLGKPKKYMATPALRKAITKEKAKKEKAKTLTKREAKKRSKYIIGHWYSVYKKGKLIGSIRYDDNKYRKADFIDMHKDKMSGKIGSNMIWTMNIPPGQEDWYNNDDRFIRPTVDLSTAKLRLRKGVASGSAWHAKFTKPAKKVVKK